MYHNLSTWLSTAATTQNQKINLKLWTHKSRTRIYSSSPSKRTHIELKRTTPCGAALLQSLQFSTKSKLNPTTPISNQITQTKWRFWLYDTCAFKRIKNFQKRRGIDRVIAVSIFCLPAFRVLFAPCNSCQAPTEKNLTYFNFPHLKIPATLIWLPPAKNSSRWPANRFQKLY